MTLTALPASPQIWPVIHIKSDSPAQTMRNAEIAHRCGCEGVFLISMEGDNRRVVPLAQHVKAKFPELKVGVNLLGVDPFLAMGQSLAAGLHATWTDSPGVTSEAVRDSALAVSELLKDHPGHQFFGSVAFKYQPHEADPGAAALSASVLGMIATTSGSATGSAPEASKLADMRAVLGELPLAVASGITPENVAELGPYLSHILVSTGVSKSFYEFDDALLADLVQRARQLGESLPHLGATDLAQGKN